MVSFFIGAEVPLTITAGGAPLAPEASEAVTAGYVALVLLGIGLLAGLAPALRAYRINPAVTLA